MSEAEVDEGAKQPVQEPAYHQKAHVAEQPNVLSEGPTPWDYLDDSERIERMRGIVRAQAATIARVQDMIYTLTHQLRQHVHVDNKIMVDISEVSNGSNLSRTLTPNEEAYF